MVPRENKNNAYAKFGGTNRVLWYFLKWPIPNFVPNKIQLNLIKIAFISVADLKENKSKPIFATG